jgi:hypothetical protein
MTRHVVIALVSTELGDWPMQLSHVSPTCRLVRPSARLVSIRLVWESRGLPSCCVRSDSNVV